MAGSKSYKDDANKKLLRTWLAPNVHISSQCTYLTSYYRKQAIGGPHHGSSKLYVSNKYFFGFDMHKQTIFIGNNSIINSLWTFIINGIYLIMIKQILIYSLSAGNQTRDGDRVRLIRATNNLRSLLLQQSTPEGYILLKFIKIWSISCFYHCSSLKQIAVSRLPFLVL